MTRTWAAYGLTADLDAKNHRITLTPSSSTDAVHWSFLSQELSNYTHKTGFTMQGDIDLNNNHIFNVATSSNSSSAVRKSYVDSAVSKYLPIDGSLAMHGELSLGSFPLTDLPEPKYPNDAATKRYVDNSLNGKLENPLTSDLDMNGHRLTNKKKATDNQDSVNLEQLNEATSAVSSTIEGLFPKKDGSNLNTSLSVNNKTITDIQAPTDDNDATNKKYINQKIADSHISTLENRENVLSYAMDNGKLTVDYGIKDAKIIDFK